MKFNPQNNLLLKDKIKKKLKKKKTKKRKENYFNE